MPYIQLRVPHIIIIFYQCKRSLILCAGYIFNGLYPMPDTIYFCQLTVITIVVVQNAMPVNFCSHGSGTPTEKADIISTMCDALHCPQCHLPRFWSRCFHPCIPSVCAGLLLHNAKMRADGTDFRQIFAPFSIIEIIGMFRVFDQTVCKIRIRIICQHIQTLIFHLVVVHIAKNTICCDKILRLFIFADDITLHLAETQCAIGNKTIVIQYLVRICGIMHRCPWHINFFPVRVSLVPYNSSPGLIQRIQRFVLFL